MMEAFIHPRRITWGDTDAARIVYTAQVPHFAMEAIEAWFLDRMGVDWYGLNLDHGYGTPFVRMEIDFIAPMKPPQLLHTTVLLEKLGRSSMTFALAARLAGEQGLRWRGRFTCAFIDAQKFRSIAVPPPFREKMEQELALAAASGETA